MPRRIAVSLHLRKRLGSLLRPAAGLSGDSSGKLHARRLAARVSQRKILRPPLHGVLCSPGIDLRFVARPAASLDQPSSSRESPGADRVELHAGTWLSACASGILACVLNTSSELARFAARP